MYKTKIQQLCHSRSWNLPHYQTIKDGPDHNPRFISTVTINGLQFHSPEPTRRSKEAQNNAAKLAFHHFSQPVNPNTNPNSPLSLPQLSSFPQPSLAPSATSTTPFGWVQEDHTGLYKNLLQEFVQKEGFRLPSYNTNIHGDSHMPTFVSQVKIEGETFTGQQAKIKKLAETSAAKVAYMTLKERKGMSDQSSLFPLSAHHGQAPKDHQIGFSRGYVSEFGGYDGPSESYGAYGAAAGGGASSGAGAYQSGYDAAGLGGGYGGANGGSFYGSRGGYGAGRYHPYGR